MFWHISLIVKCFFRYFKIWWISTNPTAFQCLCLARLFIKLMLSVSNSFKNMYRRSFLVETILVLFCKCLQYNRYVNSIHKSYILLLTIETKTFCVCVCRRLTFLRLQFWIKWYADEPSLCDWLHSGSPLDPSSCSRERSNPKYADASAIYADRNVAWSSPSARGKSHYRPSRSLCSFLPVRPVSCTASTIPAIALCYLDLERVSGDTFSRMSQSVFHRGRQSCSTATWCFPQKL